MSFCYKKILGVFTHLRVTTPNIIEPEKIIKLKSYDNHCYFSSLHFSRLGVSCECKI